MLDYSGGFGSRYFLLNRVFKLVERITDIFGQHLDSTIVFPYEVDITNVKNESELMDWIREKSAQSQKVLVSKFDFNESRQRHSMVVRFVDQAIAMEFKLRIEY